MNPVNQQAVLRKAGGGRAFEPREFQLAYMTACLCVGIDPGESILAELAELTESARDLIDAVEALRDASPHYRVFAALELLRDRARERKRNGG